MHRIAQTPKRAGKTAEKAPEYDRKRAQSRKRRHKRCPLDLLPRPQLGCDIFDPAKSRCKC